MRMRESAHAPQAAAGMRAPTLIELPRPCPGRRKACSWQEPLPPPPQPPPTFSGPFLAARRVRRGAAMTVLTIYTVLILPILEPVGCWWPAWAALVVVVGVVVRGRWRTRAGLPSACRPGSLGLRLHVMPCALLAGPGLGPRPWPAHEATAARGTAPSSPTPHALWRAPTPGCCPRSCPYPPRSPSTCCGCSWSTQCWCAGTCTAPARLRCWRPGSWAAWPCALRWPCTRASAT